MTYEANAYSGIWRDLNSAEEEPAVGAEPATAVESGTKAWSSSSAVSSVPTRSWPGGPVQTVTLLETQRVRSPPSRADPGDLVSAPKLLLHPGAEGSLMVADEVAFIESFKVVESGAALIADPVVGVAPRASRSS